MRIYPAVAMPLERVIPAGGLEIGGYYLPEGTRVGCAPSVMNYNTDIFGSDAAFFRPDRWLDADKRQVAAMEKNFFSFGTGSRLCIGKNIALLEMTKLVPQIMRHFDLEWASESPEWKVSGFWFAKQEGMHLRLIPRYKTKPVFQSGKD
jgi:cytochrome P450